MISRSKSAPKQLDKLGSEGQGYPNHTAAILSRSRTVQTSLNSYFAAYPLATPWEVHEDPFNLTGFFPSRPAETQRGWDWIKAEKPELNEGDEDTVSHRDEDLEDFRSVYEGPEERHDEMVRQVIDGEDKYGMLAFSSEKIPRLLRAKMPIFFNRAPSPMPPPSSLSDDEPAELNPEELYARYRVRREHSEERRDEDPESPLGPLFLTKDGSASSLQREGNPIWLPKWIKVVSGWVGGA